MKPISFTSVHNYLDICFEDKNPSEEDIIQAKKVYWRAYNTDLKRRKRKTVSIVQVTFSKEEYTHIQSKLQQGQRVSGYIYLLVTNHLKGNTQSIIPINTARIEQQLFLISDFLSELLDFENIDTSKLQELEAHFRNMETIIQEVL